MRLEKIATYGAYWLVAENRKDMLEIDEFANDMMVGKNRCKPMGIKVKTLGPEKADSDGRLLPIRIQIEKI